MIPMGVMEWDVARLQQRIAELEREISLAELLGMEMAAYYIEQRFCRSGKHGAYYSLLLRKEISRRRKGLEP